MTINRLTIIMTRSHIAAPACAMLAMLAMASCSQDRFKIKGEIYDADNALVILEKAGFDGRWIPLDSTRTSGSGTFALSSPTPASPEVYRLNLNRGDRYVYFPVVDRETVTLTTSASDFGVKYQLDGSDMARRMAAFDAELLAMTQYLSHPDSANSFKKRVFGRYLQDGQGDIVSYYVLTKTLGDTPLFDPAEDYPYFAAVATAFKQYRPDDPHTALLESTTLQSLKERNARKGRRNVVEAPETGYIEITLPDASGTERSLSSVIGKGKPAILVFTMLADPSTPAENRVLASAYPGVEIYQIGLDSDQYTWRDAAGNLPWTNVLDPAGSASTAALSYNVSSLPAYFVFDAGGNLKARTESAKEAVAKAH